MRRTFRARHAEILLSAQADLHDAKISTAAGDAVSGGREAPDADVRNAITDFRRLACPKHLSIPLIGAEISAETTNALVGSRVVRGQRLIERNEGLVVAPLVPANGLITAVETVHLSARERVRAVVIECEGDAQSASAIPAPPDRAHTASDTTLPEALDAIEKLEPAAAVDQLREAGVWADRWKSPDLIGQLRLALRKPIDTVICNVLDEDPAVPLQGRIARAFASEVVAGTLALAAITRAERAWAALPSDGAGEGIAAAGISFSPSTQWDVRDCWDALRRASVGTRLKLIALRNYYPQANPSLLVHELTGRRVRPGQLPAQAGVLVLDAAVAAAVGRCFVNGAPMLDVLVGVHDRAAARTHFVSVPIGTRVRDLAAQLDIPDRQIDWRAGNPLREWRIDSETVISGSEISLTANSARVPRNPDPCIRCAWCIEGCPVNIHPAGLLDAAQRADSDLAAGYGLHACIECGICTYVCPSHLPLLDGIRSLRGKSLEVTGQSHRTP